MMGVKKMNKQQFIGYEYRKLLVDKEFSDVYIDAYPNFGWEVEMGGKSKERPNKVQFSMKRNRKLLNQAELKRLQNKFEASMSNVERMEKQKKLFPTIQACLLGLFGTVFMAGAVFAINAGFLLLMIFSGVLGLLGWILPLFLYRIQYGRASRRLQPLIDEEYDMIYIICEKAYGLSHFE